MDTPVETTVTTSTKKSPKMSKKAKYTMLFVGVLVTVAVAGYFVWKKQKDKAAVKATKEQVEPLDNAAPVYVEEQSPQAASMKEQKTLPTKAS